MKGFRVDGRVVSTRVDGAEQVNGEWDSYGSIEFFDVKSESGPESLSQHLRGMVGQRVIVVVLEDEY